MMIPREDSQREFPVTGDGGGSVSAPVEIPGTSYELSDYTILEEIGSGQRGTVFRARNRPGHLVALKIFHPGMEIDVQTLRRFSRYSGGGISHPNLVPVEAAGLSDGKAFCSMAFLPGDSIEEILAELRGAKRRRPHLSPLGLGADGRPRAGFFRHAISLILEVAEGLDRAHREEVVHGWLSPRNLILGPSGKLVVTDFGAGEKRNGGHPGEEVSRDLGTLTYRAPEQIVGKSADRRVDVYALGVILYELLTRSPAFSGKDEDEIRQAILLGRFPPPSRIEPKVGPEVEAVILRAMAKDPEERYESAGELAEDLRSLVRLEATKAGAESNRPETPGPVDSGAHAGENPKRGIPPSEEKEGTLPESPPEEELESKSPSARQALLQSLPAGETEPTPATEAAPTRARILAGFFTWMIILGCVACWT